MGPASRRPAVPKNRRVVSPAAIRLDARPTATRPQDYGTSGSKGRRPTTRTASRREGSASLYIYYMVRGGPAEFPGSKVSILTYRLRGSLYANPARIQGASPR